MPSVAQTPVTHPLPSSQIPEHPSDLSKVLPKLGAPRRRTKETARPSSPPPATPNLPAIPQPGSLRTQHPVRRILSPQDHTLFLESPSYTLILSFILHVSESIRDVPISMVKRQPMHTSVRGLLSILDSAVDLLRRCPPSETESRFGNPEFRTFVTNLTEEVPSWHLQYLKVDGSGAADEAYTYFSNSFGSARRIDYGSGHELNFFMYLLCLHQLGYLPESTFPQVALIVFPKYLDLMRNLQMTYYLEPAGSHGVWGLDDYHFLPFLFGASQLRNHKFIRPLSIHNDDILEAYGDEYLYLDMVRSVNATKTVQGLRWHSPMLDDISGVKEGWGKIEGGMRKMFTREVLGKLVVMQHFLFGGIIPAVEGMTEPDGEDDEESEEKTENDHEGHSHNDSSWGDCCGIKVPSSIGAVQELKKRTKGDSLRRLPFD